MEYLWSRWSRIQSTAFPIFGPTQVREEEEGRSSIAVPGGVDRQADQRGRPGQHSSEIIEASAAATSLEAEGMREPASLLERKESESKSFRTARTTPTPGLEELSAATESQQNARQKIAKIMQYIERGAGNRDSHLQNKRHVIVLGLTDSGKSTTVNSLAGCKLRCITIDEFRSGLGATLQALVVASGEEVTKIGGGRQSQTEVLHAVAVEDMILWDAPGFQDTSGPEKNIANAVNLQRLLKDSARTDSGLAVLVVLTGPSVTDTRGKLFEELLDTLSQVDIAENVCFDSPCHARVSACLGFILNHT
jgi:hypothetical protein